jgi:hypothetical protein
VSACVAAGLNLASEKKLSACPMSHRKHDGSRARAKFKLYDPIRKAAAIWRGRTRLGLLDLGVAVALVPIECCVLVVERACIAFGCKEQGFAAWRWYHRFVTWLLFKLYFRRVSIVDPHGVLKGNRRLVFASNHPTGLFDRLLIQHISPFSCYCVVNTGLEHENKVEMGLHVTPSNYGARQSVKYKRQ